MKEREIEWAEGLAVIYHKPKAATYAWIGQWNTIFGDKRLTAAIIDRLVHHAHILSFTGESYRLHHVLSKKFGRSPSA
jgi:DNA replication protein DnaC